MMKVKFTQHGQEITLRVAPAFLDNGYRVLVNREHGATTAWVGDDGKSDRLFGTEAAAEARVLKYVNQHLKLGIIKEYTVSEVAL